MLGEEAQHAGGKALELKVQIVRRLVEQCAFSAVFFESQLYDFLDFQHDLAARLATPAQLADAIGALWSINREFDPLVTFLFEKAESGDLVVAGLDPQAGSSTQVYAKEMLPTLFATTLPEHQRDQCEAQLRRFIAWDFDEKHPFNDAVLRQLQDCMTWVQEALEMKPNSHDTASTELELMVVNFVRFLEIRSGAGNATRESGMYDNFLWHRERLAPGSKVIVWCATVHAVSTLEPVGRDYMPFGGYIRELLGQQAAVVGVSAYSGSYGWYKNPPKILDIASPESLEGRVYLEPGGDLRYVSKEELRRLGTIEARPIYYSQPTTAAWADLLDGLVIIREERPPQYVRDPWRPQQMLDPSLDK